MLLVLSSELISIFLLYEKEFCESVRMKTRLSLALIYIHPPNAAPHPLFLQQ